MIFLVFHCCSNSEQDWKKKYWKLCDMVVPNSSEKLFTDGDYSLYNVSLFQKVVDEFKLHARENKFIVREFVYNEEALAAGKNELNKLESDKKRQLVSRKQISFLSSKGGCFIYMDSTVYSSWNTNYSSLCGTVVLGNIFL